MGFSVIAQHILSYLPVIKEKINIITTKPEIIKEPVTLPFE
jgi:hypothetical protein